MKRARYIFTILKSIFPMGFYFLPKAEWIIHHPKKYNDEQCHAMALEIVNFERICSKTTTVAYGLENLPKEGGYIMYSNHQGKYDALGILASHPSIFRIFWSLDAAKRIVARQVNQLLRSQTIDFKSKTNAMPQMKLIAEEVKAGHPYLIFPEGRYEENKNTLLEFQTGCFITSLLSQSPIVPVVIYDSYKAMDSNDLFSNVVTQVHYLEPIPYEEYKTMNRKAVCTMVKDIIQKKLDELNALEQQE